MKCAEVPVPACSPRKRFLSDKAGLIAATLQAQPPWSDIPLVVLAREGASGLPNRESMNVTLVERPLKVRSLLSVVLAALRSRRRQYEVRQHLEDRVRDKRSSFAKVNFAIV